MDAKDLQVIDELRKAKKYAEAEALLRKLWAASPEPEVGWRLALCLRHQARLADAGKLLGECLERWPQHEWVRNEVLWLAHDAELKPAVAALDLAKAEAAAKRMLDMGAKDLGLRRAVFGVVKVAKARGAWDRLLDWLERLDPATLDRAPREYDGRDVPSEFAQWHFARVKALLELERWQDALLAAQEAQALFPGQRDFVRWGALALAELGDVAGALQELRAASARDPQCWYLHDSISDLAERSGEIDEALLEGCRAALGPGQTKAKIKLVERLGGIFLEAGYAPDAMAHALLAAQIRAREGWPVRVRLDELLRRATAEAGEAGPRDLPFRDLVQWCEFAWRRVVNEARPLVSGAVAKLPEGKPFGFLHADDGAEYFVLVRDVPASLRQVGRRVAFRLEPSYDRKKGKESLRAVEVAAEGSVPPPAPRRRVERPRASAPPPSAPAQRRRPPIDDDPLLDV